jgi:hypothetical protein
MLPKPTKVDVSFVELNPRSEKDVKSLAEVAKLWEDSMFVTDINYIFRKMFHSGDLMPEKPKIYALTLQKKNFDKLYPEDVLGLTEVWQKDWGANVKYLETNPEYSDRVMFPQYKGIGTGIMDMIKERFSHFKLFAVYSAANFYEKMGLELINPARLEYEWLEKGISKR